MSRDTPCSQRVQSHWEGRYEDFQRFYDAACCNGVFDEYDDDYADATIDADIHSEHHWTLSTPEGEIGTFASMADAEAAQREHRISKGLDPVNGDRPDREQTLQEFHEYDLCFDYVTPHTFKDQDEGYWRYQLSWGGPGDEIRFYGHYVDDYKVVAYRAVYVFLDWFDGAEITINLRDPVIQWLWSEFVETGTASHKYQEAMEGYEPPVEESDDE
jgi:hypothetical protein